MEADYHRSVLGPTQAHRGKIQDLIEPQVAGLYRKIYRKIMHGARMRNKEELERRGSEVGEGQNTHHCCIGLSSPILPQEREKWEEMSELCT